MNPYDNRRAWPAPPTVPLVIDARLLDLTDTVREAINENKKRELEALLAQAIRQ